MKKYSMMICALFTLWVYGTEADTTKTRKSLQNKLETLMRNHAGRNQYRKPRGLFEEMPLHHSYEPLSLTFGYDLHQALWKKLTGSSQEYEPKFEMPKDRQARQEWNLFKEHVASLRKNLASRTQKHPDIELFEPRETPLIEDFDRDVQLTAEEKELVHTLLPRVAGVYEPSVNKKGADAPSKKAPSNLKEKLEALIQRSAIGGGQVYSRSRALQKEMPVSISVPLSLFFGYNLHQMLWKALTNSKEDFEPQFVGPKSHYVREKNTWINFRDHVKPQMKKLANHPDVKEFAPRMTPLWEDFQDDLKLTDQEIQQVKKLLPSVKGVYEPSQKK